MRRLGVGFLLSLAIIGSVSAQNGSKRVDLKEITDGRDLPGYPADCSH